MGQPHHGIYWKGKDVLIEENQFEAGEQPHGNAISVRSSGIIRKNIILNSPKNGIMYYSNHPGSDSLLIENNFLAFNTYGISCAKLGNLDYHNENVIIRFITVLSAANYSVYIAKDYEATTSFSIYGNLLVNATEEYFTTFYDVSGIENNLAVAGGIDFIDPTKGDLHLMPGSIAGDYCAGLAFFPLTDIDGDMRLSETLNAGADE